MGNATTCARSPSAEFCDCPYPTTGKTDWLNYEADSCPGNLIGESAVWTGALLGIIIITWRHLKALRFQISRFKVVQDIAARNQSRIFWYQHPPLQIIVTGLLTTCPCGFIICMMKIFRYEQRQIGYDPGISTLYIFLTGGLFITNAWVDHRSMKVLLKGIATPGVDVLRIQQRFQRRNTIALSIYLLMTAVASYTGSWFRAELPTVSPMRFVLMGRNMSAIIFSLSQSYINTDIATQIKHFLRTVSVTNKSLDLRRVEQVLVMVNGMAKVKLVSGIVAAALYTIFSMPRFWPFQSILFAIVVGILTGSKSNNIIHFLKSSQSAPKYRLTNSVRPQS